MRSARTRRLPDLVADRFLRVENDRTLDLATGECVELATRRVRAGTVGVPAESDVAGDEATIDNGWMNAETCFAARSVTDHVAASYVFREDTTDLDAAVELLDNVAADRIGACTLEAASDAAGRASLLRLARASRRRGIVPLNVELVARRPDVLRSLRNRSVACLIPRSLGDAGVASVNAALFHAVRAGLRVVAVVSASRIRVGPIVKVEDALPRSARASHDARSGGPVASILATGSDLPRVAEASTPGDVPTVTLPAIAAGSSSAQATRGGREEVLASRCAARLRAADRLAAAGRRAAAIRELRAIVGVAEDRGPLEQYRTRAAMHLASFLLDRGEAAEALRFAKIAGEDAAAARDTDVLLEAATLQGHALIDLARCDEASRVLEAARAALAGDLGVAYWRAVLALARCRFWQQDAEAARRLADEARRATEMEVKGAATARAIRLATRDERVSDALALARELVRIEPATGRARAAHLLALAHADLAAHDLIALRARVDEGLRACRAAWLPMMAVRFRLVWLTGARAGGDRSASRRLAGTLARLEIRQLPPLLRARVELALAGANRAGASGARRLARLVLPTSLDTPRKERPVMDELLEVLTICHEAEDDGPALTRVCDLLRTRLDASAVCLFREGTLGRLAFAGQARGPSSDVADRAMATGRAVPASPVANGLEAAAPVRYAGATIGALSCRWALDRTVDVGRAAALLTTAAAACAPSVRSLLDRERIPAPEGGEDLGLLGVSPTMEHLRADVRRAAAVPFHVLVEGESGSGKELVARAIHRFGPRRARRFCAVNCAALTDDLLEAELFGHARGAFTGAVAERVGLFEDADGGTLFLDEVSELSPRAQAKLLRVIQEGEVRRLGENLPRRIDVRIVAATNRALAGEVTAGRFRADLRYRLEVVRIGVPPLRDRPGDVAVLARRFWEEVAARAGSRARLDTATLDALARYHWPGNVRELQNTIAALAVTAPRVGRVVPSHLRLPVAGCPRAAASDAGATLNEARRRFETAFVREALARAGGRRGAAARTLGVSRQGLAKLIARLRIEDELPPTPPVDADPAASPAGRGAAPVASHGSRRFAS